MRRHIFGAMPVVVLAALLPAAAAMAQSSELRFWVVPGGGGASTSGSLTVHGSVGQAVTGRSGAGGLVLEGGFWPAPAQAASPVRDDGADVPAVTRLGDPYPNPFNPSTRIVFEMAAAGKARVRIFDARGQVVRDLVDAEFPAGRHEAVWDGRGDQGGTAPSGVYFVRFEAGGMSGTRKMTLLK